MDTIFIEIVGSSVVVLGAFSKVDIHCDCDPGALEFESSICSTDELHSEINVSCGACSIRRYKKMYH